MTKAQTGLCMGCMGALGGQRVCPHCGYNPDNGYDKNYIPPGTVLASRYIVGRLAHKNGEGAQYIGYDNSIQKPVWIQEYFPHTIAERGAETGNILALPGYGAQYKALMSDFVDICNEVKRLSITELVVPIENVFYENNTVYAIYRDMELTPLETWLEQEGGKLDYGHALELFMPLFNTLSNIHGHGAIHRGISPYTVYIDRAERLYLWDFSLSATRTASSELEAELFNGYSAPEQYSANGWQGNWTDVYAVSALFYRAVSGVVPPKSTLVGPDRIVVPLVDLVMGIPKNVSDAVAAAMKPKTEQRTQAIATLTSQLMQGGAINTAVYDTDKIRRSTTGPAPRAQRKRSPEKPKKGKRSGGDGKVIAIGLLLTVVVLIIAIVVFMSVFYPNLVGDSPEPETSEDTSMDPDEQEEEEGDSILPFFAGLVAEDVLQSEEYRDRYNFTITSDYHDEITEGVIYDQSPEAGTEVAYGAQITLYVSRGPSMIEVPGELVGMTLEEATEFLFLLDPDLNIDVFTRYDASVPPGCVSRTVPEAGTEIDPKRTTLYLFVVPEQPVVESSEQSSESSTAGNQQNQDNDESRPFFFWEP